jgi:hypothetical membrane protein
MTAMSTSTVLRRARVAGVASIVLSGLAILLYPGGTPLDPATTGYLFFHNFLSDLGSIVAYGGRPNYAGAVLFIVSLAIMTLALGTCLFALVRLYSASNARYFALAAAAVGILACAALIGIAATPEDRFMTMHIHFTRWTFELFPVASMLLALATWRDARFRRRAGIAWLALTAVLLVYVYVLLWGPPLTSDRNLVINVTSQKLIVIVGLAVLAFQTFEADRVAAQPGTVP